MVSSLQINNDCRMTIGHMESRVQFSCDVSDKAWWDMEYFIAVHLEVLWKRSMFKKEQWVCPQAGKPYGVKSPSVDLNQFSKITRVIFCSLVFFLSLSPSKPSLLDISIRVNGTTHACTALRNRKCCHKIWCTLNPYGIEENKNFSFPFPFPFEEK